MTTKADNAAPSISGERLLDNYVRNVYISSRIAVGLVGNVDATFVAIGWLEKLLKRPPELSDLNEPTLCKLLVTMLECGRKPAGVRWVIDSVVAVWKFAESNGHLHEGPDATAMGALCRLRRDLRRRGHVGRQWVPVRTEAAPPDNEGEDVESTPGRLAALKDKPAERILLREIWESYCLERDLSIRTQQSYLYAISDFQRWLSKPPTLAELVDKFDAYIRDRAARGSKYTTHGHRSRLRAMLAAADDAGLIAMPKKIRPVRCPPLVPQAFSPEEWAALLNACGIHAEGPLLRAGLLLGYDTGLRRSDLLIRATWAGVGSDGQLVVVMSKPNRVHVSSVRPETIEAAKAIRVRGDDRLIPWPYGIDAWSRRIRQARIVAGVGHGAMQRTRRTGASHVAQAGGNPSLYLGHSKRSGESLAWKFYLDPLIAAKPGPLPPPMPAAGKDGTP